MADQGRRRAPRPVSGGAASLRVPGRARLRTGDPRGTLALEAGLRVVALTQLRRPEDRQREHADAVADAVADGQPALGLGARHEKASGQLVHELLGYRYRSGGPDTRPRT